MLKKALKISLICSCIALLLIGIAAISVKLAKKEKNDVATRIPDRPEYLTPKVISAKAMAEKVEKRLGRRAEVYSEEYQKAAEAVLSNLKKKESYSLSHPLLVVNPFGTNKTGLYIYFKHPVRVNLAYTVSVKEAGHEGERKISDFSKKLYTNPSGLPLAEQEGQIIGLMPGTKNFVSVTLLNEDEKAVEKAGYRVIIPDEAEGTKEFLSTDSERDESLLSEGLFPVFGASWTKDSVPIYDNEGVLRAEIPLKKGGKGYDINFRFLDGKLFYAVDARTYALVNSLGKAERFYRLGKKYSAYGDFDITPANRYMATFVKKKGKDADVLAVIDLYSGKMKELFDLKDLFPLYYREEKRMDLSSLRFMNDADLLINDRKTSSILKISNVFRRPEVKAVFSDKLKKSGAKEERLFFSKEGNFPIPVGQNHIFTDRKEKGKKRSFHVYAFQGNEGGKTSYFYKYLFKEGEKTVRLAEKMETPYSPKKGSVNLHLGHLILSAGEAGVFEEYNESGNRLAVYKTDGKAFYRVFKFDMKGCWFAKE